LKSPSRILFIGNSYTSRNELPRLVADLAATVDDPGQVDVEAIASEVGACVVPVGPVWQAATRVGARP
jgi:hypothetical protein